MAGKFYVGRTTNISDRVQNHFNNNGATWTKLYKPLEVFYTLDNCDPFDEDKHVIKMMANHGIHNVRGGTFSKIKLSKFEIFIINRMIRNAYNKCYKCGNSGHFIMNCPLNIQQSNITLLHDKHTTIDPSNDPLIDSSNDPLIDSSNDPIIDSSNDPLNGSSNDPLIESSNDPLIDSYIDSSNDPSNDSLIDSYIDSSNDSFNDPANYQQNTCQNEPLLVLPKDVKCFRCYSNRHYSTTCYATRTIYGPYIGDQCERCGNSGHTRITCNEKIAINGRILNDNDDLCIIL
jgi:hypothetical protein